MGLEWRWMGGREGLGVIRQESFIIGALILLMENFLQQRFTLIGRKCARHSKKSVFCRDGLQGVSGVRNKRPRFAELIAVEYFVCDAGTVL